MSDLQGRDLLLEFIQWCVDNPALSEEMLDDPLVAVVAVDSFLGNETQDDEDAW